MLINVKSMLIEIKSKYILFLKTKTDCFLHYFKSHLYFVNKQLYYNPTIK